MTPIEMGKLHFGAAQTRATSHMLLAISSWHTLCRLEPGNNIFAEPHRLQVDTWVHPPLVPEPISMRCALLLSTKADDPFTQWLSMQLARRTCVHGALQDAFHPLSLAGCQG